MFSKDFPMSSKIGKTDRFPGSGKISPCSAIIGKLIGFHMFSKDFPMSSKIGKTDRFPDSGKIFQNPAVFGELIASQVLY